SKVSALIPGGKTAIAFRSAHHLNRLGHSLLERAPAGVDAVRRAVEHGLDPADLAVLDLEDLGELPGPVQPVVVEEAEREDVAALAVDGDEAAIANPRDDAPKRLLELLLAAHDARLAGLLIGSRHVRRLDAVLVTLAVVGERIVALAVVALQAVEVVVGRDDELVARHPLALGNFLEEDRMRRTHRVDGLAGRRERTIRSGAPAEQVDLGPYH